MSKKTPKSLHQPFSWLNDALRADALAQCVADTKDLCRGIQTCLELVHASYLAQGDYADDYFPPVLDAVASERPLRLAIVVAGMLAEQAERNVDGLNELPNEATGRVQAGGHNA
ncbi:hypothetical protein [Paraherbaspirillum soli]|uniref:Uncharacterized protein n=1 Tax=Paraherbaspirillum soli TaxID=631222 RepID=A0ABW0MA01_9BURK